MLLRALRCLAVLSALAAAAFAQAPANAKKISINFGSTDKFTESCGTEGTATASGLSAAQKAAVVAKVQAKYDAALGAGAVTVCEGKGGDVDVIINGGRAPGALQGKEYGDAGKPGKPCVCHEGEFTNNGFTGDDLVNAIAETAAHEAGHKLGLGHNWDNPPSLMTEGGKVPDATRKADGRAFTADDIKKLGKNVCVKAENKDTTGANNLRTSVKEMINPPPHQPDDRYMDVKVRWLTGPPAAEFGYISSAGEFVFVADQTNTGGNETFMSFLYSAGVNLAVREGTSVFSLEAGNGIYQLNNPNPNDLSHFLFAQVGINATSGTVAVGLEVIDGLLRRGGFGAPSILNEIYASHSGTDNQEFIELRGEPGVPMTNLMVLIVEGDGTGAGILDRAWDLSSFIWPPDSFFVLGDTAVPGKDLDIGASDRIENGTETIYLVRANSPGDVAAILALLNTNIDPDADLVTTIPTLATILDIIAMSDGGVGDRVYDGARAIGPDGSNFPAGIYRGNDAKNDWCNNYLDFDVALNARQPRTPGNPNVLCCHPDQGSTQASGIVQLCLCGGPFVSANPLDLVVRGATANQPGVLVLSDMFVGVPFLGAIIGPLPFLASFPITMDANGERLLPNFYSHNGSLAGLTAYVQIIVLEAVSPLALGSSNTVRLVFLP
jgi:hypothetical protein